MEYAGNEMRSGSLCNSCLAVVPLLTAVWWIFFLSLLALKKQDDIRKKNKKSESFLILLTNKAGNPKAPSGAAVRTHAE